MSDLHTPYAGLDPDTLLDAVESLGLACDGRILALNSYENRVFRIGIEDGEPLVAKFYRPGRWTREAVLEEHAFAHELADADLPVVAPLRIDGDTLHHWAGFDFALFPLRGGRAPEAGDRATLVRLGTLLGRLHAVGARGRFAHRGALTPASHGREPLAFLLAGDWMPRELAGNVARIGHALLDAVEARWAQVDPRPLIRLHGDFHLGNLLWRDDSAHIVDLDDCLTGPAVQDLWMLLPGEGSEDDTLREALLEGYTAFRDFDPAEWLLVEPLRALRLVHYHAWVARRWHDPAFSAAFPWFGERRHWEGFLTQLQEQLARLDVD